MSEDAIVVLTKEKMEGVILKLQDVWHILGDYCDTEALKNAYEIVDDALLTLEDSIGLHE